ncbi:MAG: putative lipid II flippase FtsW [Patescibacteria group bacterium]
MKIKVRELLREIIKGKKDQPPDWYLVGLIVFLTVFGLIMLSSAGAAVGWQKFGDSYWHVKHQILFGLLPGLVLFFIFSRLDYHRLKSLASPMLFISLILLVLVFVPGIGASWGTSKSWINFFGFSLQPSEIVKLTYLIYLVSWLAAKEERHLKNLQQGFLPFLFVLGIITILMVLQPDTGTMLIIVLTSLIVYFVAGGSFWHLSWLSAVGLGGLALIIKISPYRAARLTTFLHPELDPQGIGYHINQALLAVGSGGWLGRGFGHSRQKFAYLPEVAGDSVFAILAEELGFFISAAVVALFVFLALRVLKMAKNCRDPFGSLLAVGIIVWFVIQAFLNIGAIIGVLPLTGVPLPFISYGGTSLMICLAASGILVNISRHNNN